MPTVIQFKTDTVAVLFLFVSKQFFYPWILTSHERFDGDTQKKFTF